ncbi:hypothetical protein [Pantoea agglomerans]|uniref:hypothetical protein n=1 Tax=Enterobacter agglomerans TaxID=549 RepID=UPI000DABAF3B|nr:hypothetical protein [Pantoea agglomerans]RAH33240.1 hypothetical protein DOT37_03115 [Pantoea agglomerans]TGX93479.1 hypothetical protein E5821_03105 [Pantoea agglomerans]
MDNYVDSKSYALQIRKLAASCQQGEPYTSIQAQVRAVVESYKKMLGKNPENQANGWSDLFDSLGAYLNNNSAPEWMSVIRYARKIINLKKHTAIFHVKRQHGQETDDSGRSKV